MKYSKLFGKTVKSTPKDIKLASHKLLYQAGFIRESTSGHYYFLPLGARVRDNIISIIREEMNEAGAQEILSPVMHPLELWKETNRNKEAGFELTLVTDRRGFEYALGGTAEEMMVDLVRKFQISYRDLPFNIYQFSTKFRDELRARGGLLRVREFTMKDAYSFHTDEEDFKKEYMSMWKTYSRIFKRLGYDTAVVEADNGYIGGEYCHEFVVESDVGESRYLTTEDGSYTAHEDVATFMRYTDEGDEELKPIKEVEGKGIIGVEALAEYLDIPVEKTTKTILFETEDGNVVAVALMGMYDINETKLKHIIGCVELKLASAETVKKVTGSEVGYAGILNLPSSVQVIMDESMKGRKNFEMGANKTNYHTVNVNFGRDLDEPETYYDIAMAQAGYKTKDGKATLIEKKGVEVGNIFQLGYHYTKLMKDAFYTDDQGKAKEFYMGCYGIGVGRNLATIVETHHDERGIIWPKQVAPFDVHLIGIRSEKADEVYKKLQEVGIDVLYDDREDVSPGAKFADSDLIGIPVRLVVSPKTGDKIEWKERTGKDTELLNFDEVVKRVKQ